MIILFYVKITRSIKKSAMFKQFCWDNVPNIASMTQHIIISKINEYD